jgi:hypothetical protein
VWYDFHSKRSGFIRAVRSEMSSSDLLGSFVTSSGEAEPICYSTGRK